MPSSEGPSLALVAAFFLVACASSQSTADGPQSPSYTCVVGTLSLLTGDPPPGGDGQPRYRYFVADSVGTSTELSLADSQMEGAGGAAVLVGRTVKVTGSRRGSTRRIVVVSIEAFEAGRVGACEA